MAGARGTFVYRSDDGNDYVVSVDTSNASAGGFTASTGQPNKPLNMKMRHVLLRHPNTGRERKLWIAQPDNSLYSGSGAATATIEDFSTSPSVQTAYQVKGRIGERRYAR